MSGDEHHALTFLLLSLILSVLALIVCTSLQEEHITDMEQRITTMEGIRIEAVLPSEGLNP